MPSSDLVITYQEINQDAGFANFQWMFRHLPLWHFVYNEKWRFSGPANENRHVIDEVSGAVISGYSLDTRIEIPDRFQPGSCHVFPIKGIWLPITEGTLFGLSDDISVSPLIRDHNGQQEWLFFIHPLSELLYTTLLETYIDRIETFDALALSSSRTLLIAYPDPITQEYIPLMVKVSLDAQIQGVRRVVKDTECAISVANTDILTRQLRELDTTFDIIRDPLAFVPNGYDCGMIYRELPAYLNPTVPNEQGIYVAPLLSLYGYKNQAWLHTLSQANGGTITEFLTQRLLRPYIDTFMHLAVHCQTSIEAHGQNLLLKLDHNDHVRGLVYRDMGGVNHMFTPAELLALPEHMRDLVTVYNSNYEKDAGTALEDHFVTRGLFPLSKQCCQTRSIQQEDHQLQQWLGNHTEYLMNWTLMGTDVADAQHQTHLLPTQFYRYGYVETQLLYVFIEYINRHQLVDDALMQAFYARCRRICLPDGTIVAPHSTASFFDVVLTTVMRAQTKDHGQVIPIVERPALPIIKQARELMPQPHPLGFFPALGDKPRVVKLKRNASFMNHEGFSAVAACLLLSGVGCLGITMMVLPASIAVIGAVISALVLLTGAVCMAFR